MKKSMLLMSGATSRPFTWAEGGIVTYANGYRIHTFPAGTNPLRVIVPGDMSVLVVAGGGGGGGSASPYSSGGGGGGGGFIERFSEFIAAGSYSVVVGAGGTGGAKGIAGANGGNSSIFGLSALGGGGGGASGPTTGERAGKNGGSGGGGGGVGANNSGAAGLGTSGQGSNGGIANNNYGGGPGGGGAGGLGNTVFSGFSGVLGGVGRVSYITGNAVYYGGGGSGGGYSSGTAAPGTLGGGGAGGVAGVNGSNGTNGLGGGGGSAGTNAVGGNGGSGTVVVSYRVAYESDPSFKSSYSLTSIVSAGAAFPSYTGTSSVNLGFTFSADGSKFYIGRETIYQYTLTTPWVVSTATYSSKSLAVTGGATNKKFFFKSDGMRFYISSNGGTLYQYDLSTAWDITTGVLNGSVSSTGQDANPYGMSIKPDGTKLYIVGQTNNRVYQYTLTTPWDITTRTYDSLFIGVGSGAAENCTFASNGRDMYVNYRTTGIVKHYRLATPWNISTAIEGEQYSFTSLGSDCYDVQIDNIGRRLFVMSGNAVTANSIYGYNFGSNYVLNNNSRFDSSYDISAITDMNQEYTTNLTNGALSFTMSPDGLHAYGYFPNVYHYTLSEPFNVSNMVLTTDTLGPIGGTGNDTDLVFSPDGMKLFGGNTVSTTYQYNLTTPWQVSTATLFNSASQTGQDSNCCGLHISPDGKKMYRGGRTNDRIYQYTFGTPWDITTLTYDNISFSVSAQGDPIRVKLSNNGKFMYVLMSGNRFVYEYTLTTPGDISTAVYSGLSFNTTTKDTAMWGMHIDPIGRQLLFAGSTNKKVHTFRFPDRDLYDINLLVFDKQQAVISQPSDVWFKPDGTTMLVAQRAGGSDPLYQYILSTPWDVTTAGSPTNVRNLGANPTGIWVTDDGMKLFCNNWTAATLRQINFTAAWDITSGAFGANNPSVGNRYDTFVSPDQTKIYYIQSASGNSIIHQMTMATPGLLPSSFPGSSTLTLTGSGECWSIFISTDGRYLYAVCGNSTQTIRVYKMSTPWNITTATLYKTLAIPGNPATCYGIYIRSDYKKMFLIIPEPTNVVRSYNLY